MLFDKQRPNYVKIGKRWKEFYRSTGFKEGDKLAFVFYNEEKQDYVDVTKV